MGIPDSDGGGARWSLDHLFIDQDAIPTFVEVKRSTDSRIRREVVGQMLDYAANGQRYWPVDRMRSLAAQRVGSPEELTRTILEMIGEEGEDPEAKIDQFWSDAADNLRTGKVRLVFVADSLPSELRRVLEFLNEQMPRLEVVGLELVQYQGEGLPRILVPRVVGQTEAARGTKEHRPNRSKPRTDLQTFLGGCPQTTQGFFNDLLNQAANRNMQTYWGEVGFSLRLRKDVHGRGGTIMYGWPATAHNGRQPSFQVYLHPSVMDPEEDSELRRLLLQAGPWLSSGQYTLSLPLDATTLRAAQASVTIVLDWLDALTANAVQPTTD